MNTKAFLKIFRSQEVLPEVSPNFQACMHALTHPHNFKILKREREILDQRVWDLMVHLQIRRKIIKIKETVCTSNRTSAMLTICYIPF